MPDASSTADTLPYGGLAPGASSPNGAPDFLPRALEQTVCQLAVARARNQVLLRQLSKRIAELSAEYQWRIEEDLQLSMQLDHLKARLSPPPMPMLPNDHHPGPRCSCRECLDRHPNS